MYNSYIRLIDALYGLQIKKKDLKIMYRYIKKVISKKGRTMYYLGDGFYFGRIANAEAELLLVTKQCVLWNL
jgi:hypothetical protein